jgi:uncharacterized protein
LILLDTSGLLAALVGAERGHEAAKAVLVDEPGPLVLSPFVLTELGYFVSKYAGATGEAALLAEVANDVYSLAGFDAADIGAAADVISAHAELEVGLTDASIVVLAGRYGTTRVLTLDERHFRRLRTPAGKPFTVLPADASR